MRDLIITDVMVLLPDGTIQGGQTVEVENGVISAIHSFRRRTVRSRLPNISGGMESL